MFAKQKKTERCRLYYSEEAGRADRLREKGRLRREGAQARVELGDWAARLVAADVVQRTLHAGAEAVAEEAVEAAAGRAAVRGRRLVGAACRERVVCAPVVVRAGAAGAEAGTVGSCPIDTKHIDSVCVEGDSVVYWYSIQ